jgi:glycosyltransferase involved in cell wall biosynthesis
VVIPALNEAKNLPHVLAALPDHLHQVILVDGRSIDDTIEVALAHRPDIQIAQQSRRGKGNALACGFAMITGDVVVMLDADGSADPAEIDAFVGALVEGADFAKGTRFAAGGASHDITRFRRLGNAVLNGLVNVLFRSEFTDLCYGYNAFWAHLLPVLDLPPIDVAEAGPQDMLWGDGFEVETLINIRAAEAGVRITEVGSVELVRLHGESNLNAVADGLRVLRTTIRERRYRKARAAARAELPPSSTLCAHLATPAGGIAVLSGPGVEYQNGMVDPTHDRVIDLTDGATSDSREDSREPGRSHG